MKNVELENKFGQEQEVLNHMGAAGISLWQLESILKELLSVLPGEQDCRFVPADMKNGRRLVVGPHPDGSYKQIGTDQMFRLDDWVEACGGAMKDPAIDKDLPVWFESAHRGRVRRFALLPDDWRLEVR